MSTLVFCLEEPSAREMLMGLLPRLLSENIEIRYIVFEGKSDLHKRLGKRLREWKQSESHFIVLQDQHRADCFELKRQLKHICQQNGHPEATIRIVCHELENWYLGDLAAVEQGLGLHGLVRLQNKQKYRQPDVLANAAEELSKITKQRYQKVAGSRVIGHYLNETDNRSNSFRIFISGLKQILQKI